MGENEELYNLVYQKTKIPILHPVLPLPLISPKKIRSKSSYKRRKSQDVDSKLSSTQNLVEDQQSVEIFKPKLPKSFYIIKLKEWAEEIPISGLMPSWESNILKLLPNVLKAKYPKCLEALLKDVKLIYVEEMQEFAVSSIVINEKEDPELEEIEEETLVIPTAKPLVTQNNKLFLKNQKQLKTNYFLSQNVMKHIICTARLKLTSVIVDFSIYRNLGLLSVSDFQHMILKNIRNSTAVIKHEYYKEVMKRVLTKRHLRKISKEEESRFMRCATNLFVQQILQNMMETITKMLSTMKNPSFCPQLNFELVISGGSENLEDFEANISLDPPIETVCNVFHQVIDDISNVVRNDLLCFKCEDDNGNYIKVNLPEWFLIESHDKLTTILQDLFQPLKDHFSVIVEEFTYVCTPITRDFISHLVSENKEFNVYCEHVKNFNTYLSKTNEMVSYLYYDVGRLSQITAKENLHRNISGLVKILMDKMIDYHWDYNRSIYNEFEGLKKLALDIPKSAKALFELSETISRASTSTVQKLEKKMIKSVEMLVELVQLTDLSEEHIEFNKSTINYLFSIAEVFVQSNILCEAMKSELEDELQRKINVLNLKVEEIIPEFIIMDHMDDADRVREYIEFLKLLVSKVQEVDEEISAINHEEKLFKFPETAFPRVDDIKDVILPFYNLNKMIFLWRRHNNVWLDGPFEYIDSTKVEKITLHYFEEFTELNKSLKTKIKLDMTTPNKPFKFSGIIDDPDPMQQPAPLKLCFQVIQHVKDFKQYIRLVNCMCNPALAQRHWNEMSMIYGADITPNAGTTLRKVIALDLMENIDKYEVISISANKELALQRQLDDMAREWNDVAFDIGVDVEDRRRLIFVHLESAIQVRMEEHLVKVQEMKGSYFVAPIADDVDAFHRSLIQTRDIISMWNVLQDELIGIKPIFEFSQKLQGQKLTRTIDSDFAEFEVIFDMSQKIEQCLTTVKGLIVENPTFRGIGQSNDYLKKLKQCREYIATANQKIYEYLARMRAIFPRFYFLSDDEIVKILFSDGTQQNGVDRVVRLLNKCFYGIKSVKLNSDCEIVGVISDFGQELDLTSRIKPEERTWLVDTENSVMEAVREGIDSNIIKNPNFDDSIDTFTSTIFSVSLVTLKLFLTSKIERSLQPPENPSPKLHSMVKEQNSSIAVLIARLRDENLEKSVGKKNRRLFLMNIASVLIQQRDILSSLIDKEVREISDFNWVSQIRHYHSDNMVKIEMIYEVKNYGYEYNSMINYPIIQTALTDRIHHTIFQASRNNYFCSLIGVADTGKTETVKHLAVNELGLQWHLINCSRSLNRQQVLSILKGIISCGAWATFKNINRCRAPMLSSITQELSLILEMLASRKSIPRFDAFGDLARVQRSGFITFTITLNPGRSSKFQNCDSIPDNLRTIFRPVSLRHPDVRKIVAVHLSSAGFTHAEIISKKLDILYRLCSEQLSCGEKYLFGLRSIGSIIRNAVRLRFQFPEDGNEELIILRSIIDVHLGILRHSDVPIFLGLLKDLFPNVAMLPPHYSHFLRVLEELSTSDVFQTPKNFKLKIIQILEILYIKRAVIVVGESLAGKTEILKILAKCLSELRSQSSHLGVDVVIEFVNQKSMKLENLFGYMEVLNGTRKWMDGICTSILRNFSRPSADEMDQFSTRKWLVFDGPVDSWMEGLSTILDDQRTLFLDSGEGLKILETTSVIFETDSLDNSTPSMISRCGIINMEPDTIGWRSHMRSWVLKQNTYIQSKNNHFMINLLNWSLDFALNFLKGLSQVLKVSEVFMVTSVLKLLKIYLMDALEISTREGTTNFTIHFEVWFQAALLLSIIWGMGGTLASDDSRNKLDELCGSLWARKPEQIKQPDISLPEGLIQDYNYIFKGAGVWKSWTEIIKNSTEFFLDSKFIPTTSTTRIAAIFESHIKHKTPFIICGDRSIGKTTMMHFILKKKLPKSNDQLLSNIFNFTSRTSADQAQKCFLLKINRIMKGRYAPQKDKYSINFIDDLNMITAYDADEASGSPLELIRQLMDHGYWFGSDDNDEKFQKIFVENVMFLAAITLDKTGNPIPPRFIRHFNLYSMSPPSKDNIVRIFSALLLNNLKKNQFSADISTSVNAIVQSTIQVYNAVLSNKQLRPIPITNLNYQFNLRDIGRVINGCCLIHRESAETKVTLIRLWVHESLRVFGDRLRSKEQHHWLFSTIKEAINIHFSKESFDSIFDHLPKQVDQLTPDSFDHLMFCNFADLDHKEDATRRRRYEEVTCSKETLKTKLISYLAQFNERVEESRKMSMIIFTDMVSHLIRLSRCFCTPSGNFLMLSMSGGSTGRRTLTKLAAFVQKSQFFELSNGSNWREDLKRATKSIVGSSNDCCFFVPCRYLKHEHLMDMNCLMSTGEIPDLFPEDYERQEIIKSARLPAQNGDRNLEIGIIDVINYFHEQCQEKLHFVLYVNLFDETRSKASSNYQLLKSYPNVLNLCFIDCFDDWPQEAFQHIVTKFLQDLTVINTFTKEKVVSASVNIYEHARLIKSINRYKTTAGPYAFIHMMGLYSQIITKKHEKITESRHRYQIGLEKLQYAEQEVSKMKCTLTELKPQLEWSAKQTEQTMREIETENVIVENATIQVKRDEEIANKAAEIAAILKSECEAELAVAIPILEDAIAALNTLKPADITLVKAMKNPPDNVKLVMAAVCVMLNVPSDRVIDPVTGKKSMDYWGPSKRILGEMNFLPMLKDYDKDNIPASLMMVVKKTYMTDKSFMPHIVAKASSAAEGLCKWVRAMVSYDEVAKIVAPKKEKLALAEKECNESLDFLNEKRKTLAELTSKLTALNESLRETLGRKVELESEVKSCTEKLAKSEGLIASLDGEKIKWKKSVDSLKSSLETLAGDLLISSAVIAFLPSFDASRRYENVERWKEMIQEERIAISKSYDFPISLESKITIESWRLSGLSKNRFYAENGVIVRNSNLSCLLIDPQNQANLWLRKLEEKNSIRIFKSSELRFRYYPQEITSCIENGLPILLENLDEGFRPADLDTIYQLKPQTATGCRFYMTTRLDNPSFNPYILKKTTVVNFHLPEDALHDQLLDIVVSREQPQLQERFNDLNVRSSVNKQILQQEEKNILATLSSTSTSLSILEDERALKILDTSKKLSVEILQKERAATEAKAEMDEFRQCYSKFTAFSASLYQTLTSLTALNLMYQFSLTSFMQLFMKSIDISRRSNVVGKRLKYLKCSFTQTLHSSIRNSLFEDHKVIYSFLLCLMMLSTDTATLTTKEFECFLDDVSGFHSRSKSFELSDDCLSEKLRELEQELPVFQGIADSLKSDAQAWKKFMSSGNLEDSDLPTPWNSHLSIFQKLLFAKLVKPEKLLQNINKFIDSVMKQFEISAAKSGLSESYLESTCLIPLIFLLPAYTEPLKMITDYGKKFGYTSKILTVSLGGPEDSSIQELLLNCQREGAWVVIQNCHLAEASTMFLLEKHHEEQKSGTLLGFRLWLSSLPSPGFPVGILQDGIKITSSAPRNLKSSVLNCYQSAPLNKPEFFSSCPGKDKVFSKMIYGLCLFHSVLRERNTFGNQGWNVSYNFLPSDFSISVKQLQNLLEIEQLGRRTHFVEGIFYLVGMCNYGGSVLDDEDARFVDEVLKDLCNEEIGRRRSYAVAKEGARGVVKIPDRSEYKDFLKHIEAIDDCDSILKVFGSDGNVGMQRDLFLVKGFLDSLKLMDLLGPKAGSDKVGFWSREILPEVEQLPEVIDADEVRSKFGDYSKPFNYLLIQEVNDFNSAIEKLEALLDHRGYDPSQGAEVDYKISILKEKSTFLGDWIRTGFPRDPIKLSLMSFPRNIFSAIKLMFSRECSIEITKMGLKTEILELEKSGEFVNTEKSIYIEGLVLSGGKWNTVERKLVANEPKEFFNILPIVHLTPEIMHKKKSVDFSSFLCPIYKSVNQRDLINFSGSLKNFVGKIELKTDFSNGFWVKRGTALFCNIY